MSDDLGLLVLLFLAISFLTSQADLARIAGTRKNPKREK